MKILNITFWLLMTKRLSEKDFAKRWPWRLPGRTAANGRVGIEKLQKGNFSVVISDLKMPIMSGIEVLKTIQVLQPNVPVIIITGFATVDSAVDAMKNGAFEYLTKPFLPDQILEKSNQRFRSV